MVNFFKHFQDLGITGEKAKYYDRITRENRLEEIKKQAKEVAKHIKDGDAVLEIACGAGYLAIEIAKFGKCKVTGIDISEDLVEIAKKNAKKSGIEVAFLQANASRLPFHANAFNFIVCVLSFKNFKEPVLALEEMYRVLKPGGTVLIIDLNRKSSLQATKKVAEDMGMKGLQAYIAGAIQRSISYSREEFDNFISQTRFKAYEIKQGDRGFSIYLRKKRNTL